MRTERVLAALLLFVWAVIRAQAAAEEAPPVPFKYGLGLEKYQTMCAECHGKWAEGTDKGPTLVHSFYVPSHHSDQAFYRAILQGAPMHHWKFGNMAPVPGAAMDDAIKITQFVRWLQQYRKLY
ncbi:MAG: cytochrome c [Gammaproteobacteria bacterium]|nr:cytochrome c [Gammaproteobacteria bacterium]